MSWSSIPASAVVNWEEIGDAIVSATLPAGPKPSLAQSDPGLPSGVDATWTNTNTVLRITLEWYVNTGLVRTEDLPPNTTGNTLSDCNGAGGPNCVFLSNGDDVEARIRYHLDADGLAGDITAGNPGAIPDNAQLNAELVLAATLSPSDGMAVRGEIDAAKQSAGAFGAMSDTLIYQVV